jgi:signal transduction histidine kinase
VRISGKPVFAPDGGFRGYRGAARDITATVEAEIALREAKEIAEQGNRAKSEFLATMSHELRTPLNAIIGFSEVMMAEILGPLGSEPYRGYARDINASGKHLLDIINDILDLSKAEAGHIVLAEEAVDLVGVMTDAMRFVQPRADEAGVTLAFLPAAELPLLHADPRKLKQILLNLLSNAVKFTPKDGRVELVATRDGEGRLVAIVRDTGIGIAPEDIPIAFEPFRQVDNQLSRKYHGTGLGLPLTAAMVRLHGAELKLESALGVGTSVTVVFPAERLIAAERDAA